MTTVETYECRTCHERKGRDGYYDNSAGNGTGLMSECRVCFRKRVNANNKARAKAAKAEWVERPEGGNVGRELAGVDITPCPLCQLRGHKPLDPEKCINSSELVSRSARMGEWGWCK